MSAGVQRLLRVSRTVADLDGAVAFHRDALGFSMAATATHAQPAWGELMGLPGARGRSATMRLGAQELELLAFDPPGAPYPPGSGTADAWFQHVAIVTSDMASACARLHAHRFTPISVHGPQLLPPADGSVLAYKFRDPDGHPLELIQFPEGSGDPVWQDVAGTLLGIDHSALDAPDVDASVDFYTRGLRFVVTSRTLNSGRAQQRLDRLDGDRVEVVALQPGMAGPAHVELLGYSQPRGRAFPAGMRSNDIAADRLVLQVNGLAALVDALRDLDADFVSPGVVTINDGRQAAMLRDPAGHCLMLCA